MVGDVTGTVALALGGAGRPLDALAALCAAAWSAPAGAAACGRRPPERERAR